MIEAHIHEWLNLLVRWIHFIVGVAWIGASFYFNWLENNLDRKPPQDPGIAGNLWAIHGGGFYHLKKFSTGPEQLPGTLHWFKWEAYTTWLSGFSLLAIVYYFNASAYLIDPSVKQLAPEYAIAIGIAAVLGSWFVYDLLCKSSLKDQPLCLSICIFIWFLFLSWFLSETFSGRAAFIHVGAAIGTVMVANVFFVIIPAQKEMVAALAEKRPLDPKFGKSGLLRSRHNNYLTLPVLFTMISSHFPSTYGHSWNWLVLVLLAMISIATRHYFNVRHINKSLSWILPGAFAAMVAVMWWTSPTPLQSAVGTAEQGEENPIVADDNGIHTIITERCSSCHSTSPTQPGFGAAPKGLVLESIGDIRNNADGIYQSTVATRIMPLGNLTAMTDAERGAIQTWYQQHKQ